MAEQNELDVYLKLRELFPPHPDNIVDARGTICPVPQFWTITKANETKVGEVIEVLSSDKTSVIEIQSWIRASKNELIAMAELSNNTYESRFLIKIQKKS